MTEDSMVANIVRIDRQGRINLGAFLRDDVKILGFKYNIDSNLAYVFSSNFKEDSFFLYPTVCVDQKKRVVIPTWIRKHLDCEYLGIAYTEDMLTLVPIYD